MCREAVPREHAHSPLCRWPSYGCEPTVLSDNRIRIRWENGYNESFNGKLRDELLNGEIFYSLAEAAVLVEQWRREYNTVRLWGQTVPRPVSS